MRITDAQWIPASRRQTWEALADPSVLRLCMPGLVKTMAVSSTEHQFTLRASVGGMESDYEGELLVSDIQPLDSFSIAFESKGKSTGLVIGTGKISLSDKDEGTRLAYDLDIRAGGMLAKMGDESVRRAVDRLLGGFFAKFTDHCGRLPREPAPPQPEAPAKGLIHSRWSWLAVAGLIAAFVAYHYLFKK